MTPKLRVVVADDERPARSLLIASLRGFDDVEVVGEAASGVEAVRLIERERPDLALLDLQMPELDGLGVVRTLKRTRMPLVVFVTAYDQYAVRAFEMHAVDYLLKPVDRARLRDAVNRAQERLEREDLRLEETANVQAAVARVESAPGRPFLERIPVRQCDDIFIVAVPLIASIVADGELLHITTVKNDHHVITYRLKDLETRLDPSRFVRLSRGAVVSVDLITKVTPMPGGTHLVKLANGQELEASRRQSRLLRERLLRL